jgi:hypothetical protein
MLRQSVVLSAESEDTKAASVVQCSVGSADNAMHTTCSRQRCAIWRLWLIPLEDAHSMICSNMAGAYAGAPPSSCL